MPDKIQTTGDHHAIATSPNTLLKNIVSISASGVFERFLGMVAGVFARRALGPDPIGMIGWAAAVASYPALLVSSGIGLIAKRDVARQHDRANHYVGLTLTLQLLLSTLATGIIVAIVFLIDDTSLARWLVALQIVGIILLPFDLKWLMQARENMVPLAMLTTVNAIIRTGLIVLLIRNPSDMFIYAAIAYPFQLMSTIFQIIYVQKKGFIDWQQVRFTTDGAKSLILEALPIGLSSVSTMLYYNSDVLILGVTRTAGEVGLYATSYSLMLIPGMLTGAMINAYFPSLARSQSDPAAARQISSQFLRGLIWLGFPIAALGWAVGRYPVTLLYGQEFVLSGIYFEWLSLNIALIFFNVGYSQPLNAWGQQRLLFFTTVVAGLTNVVANLLLLPRYGVPAAIATTILAEVVVMIMVFVFRRRHYPIAWLRLTLPAMGTCILAAAVARWLAESGLWVLGGILGGVVITGGILRFEPAIANYIAHKYRSWRLKH